eukprot:767017-Hanusia_phi.AAC.6
MYRSSSARGGRFRGVERWSCLGNWRGLKTKGWENTHPRGRGGNSDSSRHAESKLHGPEQRLAGGARAMQKKEKKATGGG